MDFLRNIHSINEAGPLPPNTILSTMDVSALYTNIPHRESIGACTHQKEVPVDSLKSNVTQRSLLTCHATNTANKRENKQEEKGGREEEPKGGKGARREKEEEDKTRSKKRKKWEKKKDENRGEKEADENKKKKDQDERRTKREVG
ncbi:hypothetical protein PoB_002139100 [Plakobranchus ocellatus]|uniref:Uncharacterized protein n=1 Tax=Plakobranchus ocellatus TaxID=259542 RepID=A0AAV3ZJV3_9GAST|nr:hypothetical protein PoB_002139100 [Plakobranchus ocellatus]